MSDSAVRVGVVGAGTVGSGVVELLLQRTELLARRSGVQVELGAVADLDRQRAKATGATDDQIVDDFRKLIQDPSIEIIVELVGGTRIAETIVREALGAGKAVVTANKALLAEKGRPLFDLARQKNVPIAFEAAVAGGIPIILALREGLIVNNYTSLLGIVNGTCNYILSEMVGKGADYGECLKEAQRLGYAEADPTFDVEGYDSGHKLALMSALAFESWVDFSKLHCEGISRITATDIKYFKEMGYTVRLLAVARPDEKNKRIFLSVHPGLLPLDHPLANVQGSMNAVALYGDVVMESMYYGRGAGKFPTASAVVSDIIAVARALRGGAPEPTWTPSDTPAYELADMADYRTEYYIRFPVPDQPGVLAKLADALGKRNVSIATVDQDKAGADGITSIVLETHEAREGDVMDAIEDMRKMFPGPDPIVIRLED